MSSNSQQPEKRKLRSQSNPARGKTPTAVSQSDDEDSLRLSDEEQELSIDKEAAWTPEQQALLTDEKRAMLKIIEKNWSIKHVSFLFNEKSREVLQPRGLNDDFFEPETFDLMRRLSELTVGKVEEVKGYLNTRWNRRHKGRKVDVGVIRRRGGDDRRKNRNLRNDLRFFLRQKRKLEGLGPHWESETADDEADVKRSWDLSELTKIMPEHSFPPALAPKNDKKKKDKKLQPQPWPPELLQAVQNLAMITNGQQQQIESQLATVFSKKPETSFDLKIAVKHIRAVSQKYTRLGRQRMLTSMSANWPQVKIPDDLPDHAYTENVFDWPLKLFRAIFDLSKISAGKGQDAIERLNQAFVSTEEFKLPASLKLISKVHASFEEPVLGKEATDQERQQVINLGNATLDENQEIPEEPKGAPSEASTNTVPDYADRPSQIGTSKDSPTNDNSDENPVDDEAPPSPGVKGIPPTEKMQRALNGIYFNWEITCLSDFMPLHSLHPNHKEDNTQIPAKNLMLLYSLAKSTHDRKDEAKEALRAIFEKESHYRSVIAFSNFEQVLQTSPQWALEQLYPTTAHLQQLL